MRKRFTLLSLTMLAVFLTACGMEFNGSRMGNDHEFTMKYKILNKTETQEFDLQSGDIIHSKIIANGGTLAITIRKEEEEPIYESNGISASNDFDVTVSESGTYTITVTGKRQEEA